MRDTVTISCHMDPVSRGSVTAHPNSLQIQIHSIQVQIKRTFQNSEVFFFPFIIQRREDLSNHSFEWRDAACTYVLCILNIQILIHNILFIDS